MVILVRGSFLAGRGKREGGLGSFPGKIVEEWLSEVQGFLCA